MQPPRSWLREERIELRMQSHSPLSQSIRALRWGSWKRWRALHQPVDRSKIYLSPGAKRRTYAPFRDRDEVLFCLLHDLEAVIGHVALGDAAIVDHDFLRSRGNFHANDGFILGANFEPAHDFAAGKFDDDRDL